MHWLGKTFAFLSLMSYAHTKKLLTTVDENLF